MILALHASNCYKWFTNGKDLIGDEMVGWPECMRMEVGIEVVRNLLTFNTLSQRAIQ